MRQSPRIFLAGLFHEINTFVESLTHLRDTQVLQGEELLGYLGNLNVNVSSEMARHADALVPYRKNPHTDAKEAAVRAAGILNSLLTAKNRFVMACAHSRIMLTP